MNSRARLPLTIVLAVSLAVAAPLLSGCSMVGGVVSGLTGGAGGTSVPDDFPSGVPLIDGDVQFGVSLGDEADGKVWNVTVKTTDTDASATIKGQMEGAGFTSQEVGTTSDGESAAYDSDDLGVLVVVGTSNNDIIVNYTVTEKTDTE